MSDGRHYASPKDFRRALTDKLRHLAKDSRWELPQLQRQIAYDRLLVRLYMTDEGWILKGATALLARGIGVRGTLDIDLYRHVAAETAAQELRAAAAIDLGDWFQFGVGSSQVQSDGETGLRLPVKALVGGTVWSAFHVDLLGAELTMTGTPDEASPLARVTMPDIEQRAYNVYPLVDHIADKVAATFDRYGASRAVSTRYKDLVDLVVFATSATVQAEALAAALASEADRRDLQLPGAFDAPDRSLWEPGYKAEAGRSLLDAGLTLDAALETVKPFLDPVLKGTAEGVWDPAIADWR